MCDSISMKKQDCSVDLSKENTVWKMYNLLHFIKVFNGKENSSPVWSNNHKLGFGQTAGESGKLTRTRKRGKDEFLCQLMGYCDPINVNQSFMQGVVYSSVVYFIPGPQNGVQICVDLVDGSETGVAWRV